MLLPTADGVCHTEEWLPQNGDCEYGWGHKVHIARLHRWRAAARKGLYPFTLDFPFRTTSSSVPLSDLQSIRHIIRLPEVS